MQNTQQTKNNKRQIAIFGSAFNPPTLGHLSLLEKLSHFDLVLLVPSFSHAWGKKMADFDLRCYWIELFIKDAKLANLSLCTDEKHIFSGDAVTTWALLSHLENQYSNADLSFVIGPDNLINFNKYYRAKDILSKWNILSLPETVNIRSTHIRAALENNQSIEKLTTVSLSDKLKSENFNW